MINALYRGKRVDNGEWVQGWLKPYQNGGYDDIKEYPRLCIQNGSLSKDIYEVIPETVGQWTGLFDRNEVKLFIGDIIKDVPSEKFKKKVREDWQYKNALVKFGKHNPDTEDCFIGGTAYGVYFDGYVFYTCPLSYAPYNKDIWDWDKDEYAEFEIVGNQWDNPDLLK